MDENTYTIPVSDLEPTGGDPAEMKPGDGNAPPDMPGGGEGGQPGGSSSSVTWSGATEITDGGTYSNQTYTSTTANQNALLIDTDENVTLTNATVRKSGSGDGGDNSSFYGTNAGVLVKGGSTTTINGGTITTSANGANGVFSYGGNGGQNGAAGDGTTVVISNTTINTTGDGSGGIMTTGGGGTRASNLTVTTTGQSSAPIRSDRGGGTVSVSGGSYTSSGLGSPAIYSTADITVENATLTSNLSEGVCIEGQNSVALTNCTLTANNTRTNGNAQFLDAVILYQSMSGDSASGTATFSMTGGKLVNKSGHVFHVTNTNAVINLNDVDIDDSGSGVLLSVSDDGWSGASNVATLNASGQELDGDILVGNDSTLTLNLTGGTTFNGNISGNITNNAGTVISSEVGTVNVSLDAASKWYLDGDAYINSFSGTAANVITNGHTLYVNNSPLSGTTESDDSTPSTVVTALNIANSVNNTLINGSGLNDTIINSGTRVTIAGLGGNDSILNDVDSSVTAASLGNSIDAGDGDDYIYNHHSYNPTISGGAGNDSILVSRGHLTYIDGGDGNDSIIGFNLNIESDDWAMGGHATILGGAGADYINPIYANNASIDGGAGNDTLIVLGKDATVSGGAGNDRITLPDPATLREGDVEGADDVVIVYNSGDGNDVITGFTEDSTLSVGSALYSTAVSGNNLIVSLGDGSVTLNGAASLDAINIESKGDVEIATSLVGAMLYRTEEGYPVIAGIAFHPTVYHGDEPTNYAAKENWTIESADGLELEGVHYMPENSNDKWVVIIHGYGHNHKHMYPFAGFYLTNGYNVLMVDQRAAGDSQGDWLTMGTAESADIALWTQEIARRNSDAKITLFGVSMGAATAMLAAARSDTANVTSLVEDCGYSNVVDIIDLFNNLIFQEDQETIDLMQPISESLTGYNLKDAAPINSISSVKVPTLFITGGDDSVVGTYMLSDLYDASGAEVKEKFIVPGAGHGVAGLTDPIGYSNTVFRFVAEADGEGWETANVTDGISLRGTSYNDTITNYANNVTINTGAGDDIISVSGSNDMIVYASGDGNDTVTGATANSTLSISGGTDAYSTVYSGDDVILTVDDGSVRFSGARSSGVLPVIVGASDTSGGGSDTPSTALNITNSVNNTLITGTALNDTITNSGDNVTIDALGGNDYIVNDVDSSVTTAGTGNSISAGAGDDTIYNHHSYRPTLIGGDGNDSIVVSRGHLTYVDAGNGNDTIIGRKTGTHENDWEIGGYATVLGGAGNDYINTGYSNSASVDGGDGNDTICATGNRITINGGAGSNVVSIAPSSLDADNDCAYVVFSGNTTVQGFKTGWGNGSDTVYIPGDPAGVEFRAGGLTFLNSNDTLALEGVTSTAKVNLYHERRQMLNKGVFIADNEWYSVESGDLSVRSGEEVYFVGPSANNNYGVDFSGISSNLNLTLDTAYVDSEDYVPGTTIWINSVHSIRGGAGNTTIIGSAHSDTIIASSGRTTIDGAGGNDRISLGSAAALVKYNSGGGNDSVYGFNANSTISIGGGRYSSATSGSNLILTVGSDNITLFGAADVSNPHILGTLAGGSSSQGGGSSSTTSGGGSTTSGGSSSSTTSGGGSGSTTSGGSSSSTTSGGSSSSTTSGGGSSSTTSGGGSSSTTSGGGSGSTTSGGGSSSTTSGGSSISTVSGATSSVSGGGSSSTTSGGSSVVSGGTSTATTSGGTSTNPTIISGGTSTATTTPSGTSTATTTPAADYVYTGGDDIIVTYEAGEKIALGTPPTSGTFVDGSLVLSAADGNLVVYDVLNTVVEFTDGNGNDYIKAYAGTNPGVIDGRNTSGFELIAGSDAGADLIFAGANGSSMWGGFGSGADTLIGGAGSDVFAAGKYQGADLIGNAETKDIINVTDATLSDIVATAEQNGVIAVTFNNGNVIAEQSAEVLSAAFMLADGSKWRYNHATKGWQSA